jgi:protein-tyrosine phosphatase
MGAFQLLLNLTGTSVLSRHVIPVPELHRWEEPAALPEIVLDWPDMGVVSLPRSFWEELVAHLANTQRQMLLFCVGGHGRTGTALACLMVVCGWTGKDAIAWIRANYCRKAIETREQERYILQIERDFPASHAALNELPG